MRCKPITNYIGNVNAYIFQFSYILYLNKLVKRTEKSVYTAEIDNNKF